MDGEIMAQPQQKPVQTDPWEVEAKNFKPSPGGGQTAPAEGGDDWKIWQGGGERQASSEPGITDYRPPSKVPAANFTEGVKEFVRPANNMFSAGLRQFTDIPKAMTQPPEKPSIGDTLGRAVVGAAYDPIKSLVKGGINAYKEGGLDKALTETAGPLATGAMAGELGANAIARIPSTTRAANTLSNIETKAANTPVGFQNTEPALQKFAQHVATGGKGADVMEKLNSRINAEPMNFPEARDFYTNVSDVTRKPGFLRRAFEDAREPRLRYAAGPVREGLNADLTESLKPLNLDEDYNAALKEYARGKALKSGLKKAGIAAAGAGAGALGLGKIHGIASSVLR